MDSAKCVANTILSFLMVAFAMLKVMCGMNSVNQGRLPLLA